MECAWPRSFPGVKVSGLCGPTTCEQVVCHYTTPNNIGLHSLIQTVASMQKKKILFKASTWQSIHGSKPISFNHIMLTSEWVLHKQLHLPTSIQAGESLEPGKNWYPEKCLGHLLIGRKWPNGRCGVLCPRGRS